MTAPESRRCVDIVAAERDQRQCQFEDGPAVVHVALDAGCACFPDDREQFLCEHHWYKSTPLGSFDVLAELPSSAERDDHGQPIGEHPELAGVARVETPAELACREIRELADYWRWIGADQPAMPPAIRQCGMSVLAILDRLGA